MPTVHTVKRRHILSYKKIKCRHSALLRVLGNICYCEILSAATKNCVHCLDASVSQIKNNYMEIICWDFSPVLCIFFLLCHGYMRSNKASTVVTAVVTHHPWIQTLRTHGAAHWAAMETVVCHTSLCFHRHPPPKKNKHEHGHAKQNYKNNFKIISAFVSVHPK